MHSHQRARLLGWGAAAVALASLLLLFLAAPGSPWAGAPVPLGECGALSTWLSRWMSPGAYSNTTLPLPKAGAEAGDTADLAMHQLDLVTHDTLRRLGWRSGVRFAELSELGSLERVLASPWDDAGAFLVIVPAGELPPRRGEGEPFLSVNAEDRNLTRAFPEPGLLAINRAMESIEGLLGRRLFPFRLESAPLPPCASGSGPCAVWDVGSGRVVLHSGLVSDMAGLDGLHKVVGAFAGRLAEQLAAAVQAAAPGGVADLPSLAALFARASAAAAVLLLAGQLPVWFCIACPTILGLVAPFIFNFGLTTAADALCHQMQLPGQECEDLWWGAFALAMVLSLGSAIPIVYICRLPDCIKHITP